MSDAKDWAGELISGQSGTGKILVCLDKKRNTHLIHLFFLYSRFVVCSFFPSQVLSSISLMLPLKELRNASPGP